MSTWATNRRIAPHIPRPSLNKLAWALMAQVPRFFVCEMPKDNVLLPDCGGVLHQLREVLQGHDIQRAAPTLIVDSSSASVKSQLARCLCCWILLLSHPVVASSVVSVGWPLFQVCGATMPVRNASQPTEDANDLMGKAFGDFRQPFLS